MLRKDAASVLQANVRYWPTPLGVNRTSTAAIPFGKFYRAFECIIFTGPLSSREQGSEGATLKIGAVLAEVGELIRSTARSPVPREVGANILQ